MIFPVLYHNLEILIDRGTKRTPGEWAVFLRNPATEQNITTCIIPEKFPSPKTSHRNPMSFPLFTPHPIRKNHQIISLDPFPKLPGAAQTSSAGEPGASAAH